MATKYKSKIMSSMHRTVSDLYEIGAADKKTMRDFDRMCLTETPKLTAAEIRAIREKAGVSQAVFADSQIVQEERSSVRCKKLYV